MSSQPVDRATQRRRFLRAIGRSDAAPDGQTEDAPADEGSPDERANPEPRSSSVPADEDARVALADAGPGEATRAADGAEFPLVVRSSDSSTADSGTDGSDRGTDGGMTWGRRTHDESGDDARKDRETPDGRLEDGSGDAGR